MTLSSLLSDGSKTAFFTDTENLKFLTKSHNGSVKFTKLNQNLLTNHWSFMFFKNHFILKAFNRKIPQLVESGIADLIIKTEAQYKERVLDTLTKPLAFKHLEYWFKLVLILYGTAGFLFVVEVLIGLLVQKCK